MHENRQAFIVRGGGGGYLGEVEPENGGWIGRPYGRSYPAGRHFATAAEAETYVREQARRESLGEPDHA